MLGWSYCISENIYLVMFILMYINPAGRAQNSVRISPLRCETS